MMLRKEEYSGDIHKKLIVSSENGRRHIAENPSGNYEVRHYHLDGEILHNTLCCDYLLINDSRLKAYYIELKGSDLAHAVDQVIAGERQCKDSLQGYESYYRIITSKTRTQELYSMNFRRFERRVGPDRIIVKTKELRETL